VTDYPSTIPTILHRLEASSSRYAWMNTQPARARWFHYNVFSIPWRGFEIADVLQTDGRLPDMRGQRILDLGCGAGTMDAWLIADQGADVVVGVDRDVSVASVVRDATVDATRARLLLVQADATLLPIADCSIDIALSYDSIHSAGITHELLVDEVFRVIRPGGLLVVKMVNRGFPPYGFLGTRGVQALAASRLMRTDATARLAGLIQPNSISSFRAVRMVRTAGFTHVELYNRLTRAARGLTRWILPDVILVATKPTPPYITSHKPVT